MPPRSSLKDGKSSLVRRRSCRRRNGSDHGEERGGDTTSSACSGRRSTSIPRTKEPDDVLQEVKRSSMPLRQETRKSARRTRSCESRIQLPSAECTTTSTSTSTSPPPTRTQKKKKTATKKKTCQHSRLVDEQGLPLTSEFCPPVASLPTSRSPDHVVDMHEFLDSYKENMSTRKLHLQLQPPTMVKDFSEDEDRKMPANIRKPKAGRRKSTTAYTISVVPFNPEEEACIRQRQIPGYNPTEWTAKAHEFVPKLDWILTESSTKDSGWEPSRMTCHDKELVTWCMSMAETRHQFASLGKPTRVNVGYHYCRRDNLRRLQQHPGLWSQIQSRGAHKSQDGDGIFTFDSPLLVSSTLQDNNQNKEKERVDDVWMIVARLQGKTALFSCNYKTPKRKWQGDVDSLIRPEDGVMVLKTCQQFFPLALLPSSRLRLARTKDGGLMRQLEILQHGLQTILEDCFPEPSSSIANHYFKSPAAMTIEPMLQTTTSSHHQLLQLQHDKGMVKQLQHDKGMVKPKKQCPTQKQLLIQASASKRSSRTAEQMTMTMTTTPSPSPSRLPPTVKQGATEATATTATTATPAKTTIPQPLLFSERVSAVSTPAAWDFAMEVQRVVEEHACIAASLVREPSSSSILDPAFTIQCAVYMEEMAVLAENMFRTQKNFRASNKPGYVEIGYHYCRGQNLRKLQQKPGFWSNIQSRGVNRSEDGDGIYTFDNPLGTRSRSNRGSNFFDLRSSVGQEDDVWLLVARLQGNRQPAPFNHVTSNESRQWLDDHDSMVMQADGVVVLRTSLQFFPLLQFPASSTDSSSGVSQTETVRELQMIHQRLQSILEAFFNKDEGGREPDSCSVRLPKMAKEILEYLAPETMDLMKSIHSTSLQVYKVLSNNKKASNDDCSICLDSLRWTSQQQVVRLKNCGHEFHRTCLHEALDHFDLCPICNQPVAPEAPQSCLQGLSPSGMMVTTTLPHVFCEGYWAPGGSLVLSYFLPEGLQKGYHESPGTRYSSSDWHAYLPRNEQGLQLLRRLQYAFLHGLLFVVEAGNQGAFAGQTSWSTIPQKTSLGSAAGAGEYSGSYPDPTYFERCNHELDRCGVPDAFGCQRFVLSIGRALERPRNDSTQSCPETTFDQKPLASMRPQEIDECSRILTSLKEHPSGWMFCKTLPVLVGKVENPLDLVMIEQRLKHNEYSSIQEFRRNVNIVFDSALMHHSKENPVHFMAKQLKKKFKQDCKQ